MSEDLARLETLSAAGDKEAAWALLREGRRRVDPSMIERARAVLLAGSAGLGSWLEAHKVEGGLSAGVVRALLMEALEELAKHHDNLARGDVWNLDALQVWVRVNPPQNPGDVALIALRPAGDGWLQTYPDGTTALPKRAQTPPSVTLYGTPPLSERTYYEDLNHFAPEVLRGERRTVQTDLYSMAVMGYSLWSGELPFLEGHPSMIELLMRVLNPARALPARLMADPSEDGQILRGVILRGLQVQTSSRFEDARAMLRALGTAEPPPAPPAATAAPKVPTLPGKTANRLAQWWERLRRRF